MNQQSFVLLALRRNLKAMPRGLTERTIAATSTGGFILGDDDFQVKNIINLHLGLALDDAAAQREVQHGSFASDLSSGKREAQPHRNPEVFTAVDGMVDPGRVHPTGQETGDNNAALNGTIRIRCRHQFTGRLRPAECTIFATPGAIQLTTHWRHLVYDANSHDVPTRTIKAFHSTVKLIAICRKSVSIAMCRIDGLITLLEVMLDDESNGEARTAGVSARRTPHGAIPAQRKHRIRPRRPGDIRD